MIIITYLVGEHIMETVDMKTYEYYEKYAHKYAEETKNLDMSIMQNRFLQYLEGKRILDFGCGTGRDSKFFLSNGCDVELLDASPSMCAIAEMNTGITPKCMFFQDFDASNQYDGIWACASLLHLHEEDLKLVLKKLNKALNFGGIFYASFKLGDFEGIRSQRFFMDMSVKKMEDLLKETSSFKIVNIMYNQDVRENKKNAIWINFFIKKEINNGL